MNNPRVMELKILSFPSVMREMKENGYWIGGGLALVALYMVASSLFSWYLNGLQQGENIVRDFPTHLYFTIINVTTVGFGDVSPITAPARFLASLNALAGVVMFGLIVAIVAAAFQPSEMQGSVVLPAPGSGPGPAEPEAASVQDAQLPAAAQLVSALEALLKRGENESARRIHLAFDGDGAGATRHAIVEIVIHVL